MRDLCSFDYRPGWLRARGLLRASPTLGIPDAPPGGSGFQAATRRTVKARGGAERNLGTHGSCGIPAADRSASARGPVFRIVASAAGMPPPPGLGTTATEAVAVRANAADQRVTTCGPGTRSWVSARRGVVPGAERDSLICHHEDAVFSEGIRQRAAATPARL